MAIAETTSRFGDQLRWWRRHRRYSQLDLAAVADVSAKHVSFLETGRSAPSREMVLHLARHLDVPIRHQNDLLLAAGYSPRFAEHRLDDEAMAQVRHVVELHLAHHEPYPAICVDRRWDLVSANRAAQIFLDGVAPHLLEPPVNVLRVSLHPDGLAPRVVNFADYAAHLVSRLRGQAAHSGDEALGALLDEVCSLPGVREHGAELERPGAALAMRIRLRDDTELSLISTIATFGAPLEVSTAELAIEAFYPADAASDEALTALASTA